MIGQVRVRVFLLFCLSAGKSSIYLSNTNDGQKIELYDCVRLQSVDCCRRPRETLDLSRDNQTTECEDHGGKRHRFNELQAKNINISTVLHRWKSTVERVEDYARYRKGFSQLDGSVCQCFRPGSFGKDCEYQLPVGETLEETLQWQLTMREQNPNEVQIYGDVVCYETLQCDSGALYLDWREICDGIQHCLEGRDGEKEYRRMNGMCIPDEFFLDGEFDCLDRSDEMSINRGETCPLESVSTNVTIICVHRMSGHVEMGNVSAIDCSSRNGIREHVSADEISISFVKLM